MKAGNCSRVWRPAVGVMLVGALAFAVTAQGGPRETGSSRDTNRPKSETARMISGPSGQIQQAVTAGAGIIFRLTPRKDYPGGSYNSSIYAQANVSGQTLSLTGAPGRVYIELQLNGWGPQFLRIWETYVDSAGYMSGTGTALIKAIEACANTAECQGDFGVASGPICSAGTCAFAFIQKTRTDGIQLAAPIAPCSNNIWDVGNLSNPSGHNYFGVLDQFDAGANQNCGLPDPGTIQYAGAFALDVLAGAAGTYTIPLQPAVTIAQDDSAPDAIDIPIQALMPAIITIPTGSCCFGIGTLGAGCVNGDTAAQCSARPAVNQFAAGDTCDNPPTDDGCCACLTNADCNDNDACTNDTCSNCICSNIAKASWDQATECCDAATGNECTPTVSNTCQTAACSIPGPPGRGVCVTSNIADGDPCTGDDNGEGATQGDANPCTYDDVCTAGTCAGTDINASNIACTTEADCLAATDVGDGTGATAASCQAGLCNCSLIPKLTVVVVNKDEGKDADGDSVCFPSGNPGAKIIARIHVGPATTPINGGQFLITYDPTCLRYNSAVGVATNCTANPADTCYGDQVFGPVVNTTAGTIFTVVGVGFGVGDGPAGNADMVELSFTKIGDCNECQICFDSNNPQNTYLASNSGQRVNTDPDCSQLLIANNVVTIDVPETSKHNVDCDATAATVTWSTPTVTDSCGNSTLTCEGEHQSGLTYSQAVAMGGGTIGVGFSNFCCTAHSDWCDKEVTDCWTVEVNDETSLDVKVALSPSAQSKPGDDLTRCIKFTLYPNTIQAPTYFETDLDFGGVNEFVGKAKDVVKIGGHGRWDCIVAWDQLHTLRSCYLFDDGDCVDGVLHASFEGDPAFGGNWLISGNLDGYKKSGPTPEGASLYVIDIVDYVDLVATWGTNYGTGDTPCGTAGPHGDIDGDGLVGLSDYTFISMNFLTSMKLCCGVQGLPASATPITEISVKDLRLQGYSDAAKADLNGDGMVNVDDMNLFGQGVRPESKNLRGVRKNAGTR